MLSVGGISLVVDVRPAAGVFHRTLVVSIRNMLWVENRTEHGIQWCEPQAFDSRGILLSAHVHFVPAGEQSSVSWSFATDSDFSDRSMCFRITEDAQGKHSDWLWSQPIPVEKSRGEFPAKMYRPKTHDQYIARVVTHRLEGGSLLLQLYPEDKDHPPYRIRNLCLTRAVAFRQLGASKSNPWLLRPGMSTRYSWDNILAPKRKQVLVLEVIETIMVSDGDVDRVEEIISP
eukprot:CAMPEP_0184703804 /NCGR_PEP_ID=MMETSP0313-20130426/28989_1 /TAXON_ID=2792 /ORGANISM="Porphyridium aerugineum, Strain SAG 1380-2" /LENGTH=230 /DNA_ID=CAMNT_0027164663 /DNA_START=1 /DNA_END=689 /DNA_ORIENTATION=-